MNEQPEALRIADELLALHGPTEIDERAAAELRRLHEANKAFGKRQEWWNDRMFKMENALRQALDALEWGETKLRYEAITAVKQALGKA